MQHLPMCFYAAPTRLLSDLKRFARLGERQYQRHVCREAFPQAMPVSAASTGVSRGNAKPREQEDRQCG